MNAEKQLEIPSMKGLVAAFEVGKKSQDPKLVRKNLWKCQFLNFTLFSRITMLQNFSKCEDKHFYMWKNFGVPNYFILCWSKLNCFYDMRKGEKHSNEMISISWAPNLCSAVNLELIFALRLFFGEQRDNFRISCNLIGWKKSLSVRLFWKLSLSQKKTVSETKFQ